GGDRPELKVQIRLEQDVVGRLDSRGANVEKIRLERSRRDHAVVERRGGEIVDADIGHNPHRRVRSGGEIGAGDDRHVQRIEEPRTPLAVRGSRVYASSLDVQANLARGFDEAAVPGLRSAPRGY